MASSAVEEKPSQAFAELESRLLAAVRAELQAGLDRIRQLAEPRDQLQKAVSEALANIGRQQREFHQQLVDGQEELLRQSASPVMAGGDAPFQQLGAEIGALNEQLTLIREELARVANDRNALEQRLIDREREVPRVRRGRQSKQTRNEIRAFQEAAFEQIRDETQQLRDDITTSVTNSVNDRITSLADEQARFRARLVALAGVVETRFNAFADGIHARFDQIGEEQRAANVVVPRPPARKALKASTATQKAALRGVTKAPPRGTAAKGPSKRTPRRPS